MARSASTFRQRDVTAAIKAVAAAGCSVARVEVDRNGRIVITTAAPTASALPERDVNEWDAI